MIDLNDYYYFVHVVEKGGYSAAARALNMPKSRLSRHISQLEERLAVRLLQRSSRSISVTEVGKVFYQHARNLLDNMEQAEASIAQIRENICGKIVVSCSVGAAHYLLSDLISQFMLEQPNVEIDQHVSNETVDLVADGIDLAIRGHQDNLPDSSLIQRPLASVNWQLFASPEYLAKQGVPSSPYDLTDHSFLKIGWRSNHLTLHLRQDDGLKASIPVTAKLCSDDMGTLAHAAKNGLGIASLPHYVCTDAINNGSLIRVLPNWQSTGSRLSLLMPTRAGIAPQVKAFADFIQANMHQVVRK